MVGAVLRFVTLLAVVAAFGQSADAGGARSRILYASDWPGPTQLFAIDPSHRLPTSQLTFSRAPCPGGGQVVACGFTYPVPSPDGKRLVYRTTLSDKVYLAAADGRSPRLLGTSQVYAGQAYASWSPDSRRLAFATVDGIHILHGNGTGDRFVVPGGSAPAWSPDGRALAYWASGELRIRTLATGRTRAVATGSGAGGPDWSADSKWLAFPLGSSVSGVELVRADGSRHLTVGAGSLMSWATFPRWSPRGLLLAFGGANGVMLYDARSGTTRALTSDGGGSDLAWSPDGRSIAYIQGGLDVDGMRITTGALRVVRVGGRVRTLVIPPKAFGGQMVSIAWARAAKGLRYRKPAQTTGVFAGGVVSHLAAAGPNVAFAACRHVYVWNVQSSSVREFDDFPEVGCFAPSAREQIIDLAVSDDRVEWGEKTSGLSFMWKLRASTLGTAHTVFDLASGFGGLGGAPVGGGTMVGTSRHLFFSTWNGISTGLNSFPSGMQTLYEVGGDSCGCHEISTGSIPFVPLDADGDSFVVDRGERIDAVDASGSEFLSVAVATRAAQLDLTRLVVALRGELRVYDTTTALPLHSWPLPDATVGGDCSDYGTPLCPSADLRLMDAAGGRVAYALDGRIHVLRVDDGVDKVVAFGTLARFADNGLAIADGARVRAVPIAALP